MSQLLSGGQAGCFDDDLLSLEVADERLHALSEHFQAEARWRGFKDWVQKTKPKDQQLALTKLKLRTPVDAASCSPAVISKALSDIERILLEENVMGTDKIIKPSDAFRLIVVDEKGFSQRADALVKGITSRVDRYKAAGTGSSVTWEHITVTTFLPLGPLPNDNVLPFGVVVPTSSSCLG